MSSETLVYVGTYTHKGSEGIYIYRLDPATGALTQVGVGAGVANPSFLAMHPNKRYLYAVNEAGEFKGYKGGGVSALRVGPGAETLTLLNQKPTLGGAPCHVCLNTTGTTVVVANYSGGSLIAYPVEADGSLGEHTFFEQRHGCSGIHPRRQQSPFAHCGVMDPTGRHLVSCDLGMDQVFVYQWGATPGSLVPNDPPYATVPFGSGPRHITFHPNGQFAYAISEIGNTVVVFKWDAAKGVLTQLQVVPTLPAGWEGVSHCADLHVSADGRFLYGSNRGHDSLAIFSVNAATGQLTPIGHQSTQGKTPRNFTFTPDGAFILAANQDTDNIVTLKVDKATGLLSETGIETQVSMPVCVLMAPQG